MDLLHHPGLDLILPLDGSWTKPQGTKCIRDTQMQAVKILGALYQDLQGADAAFGT